MLKTDVILKRENVEIKTDNKLIEDEKKFINLLNDIEVKIKLDMYGDLPLIGSIHHLLDILTMEHNDLYARCENYKSLVEIFQEQNKEKEEI